MIHVYISYDTVKFVYKLSSWCLIYTLLALKNSSSKLVCSSDADKLTTALFNIRSIASHFAPKIDALTAANESSPVTPNQVWAMLNILCDNLPSVVVVTNH